MGKMKDGHLRPKVGYIRGMDKFIFIHKSKVPKVS
jgi:hypothetical protein